MFAKIYDIQKCGCVYGTKYGRNVIYRNGTMYKTMYIYIHTHEEIGCHFLLYLNFGFVQNTF